jgi:uncharacterized protein (TIGR03435 family)
VVDQTGLNGTYDVHLVTGLPDLEVVQRNALAGGNGSDSSLELLDMRVPFAIRGAMKQQLGLELHETKLSIPTLVIERWNRPR